MLETFLFIGLPYLSIFLLIFGSIYRFRSKKFSYSALSSQMLENKKLLWGSIPFHLGILIILVGHLLPFLFSGAWHSITTVYPLLVSIEVLGFIASALTLFGLVVLVIRRLTSAHLQQVTSLMDLLVLALLLFQVALGVSVAVGYRWGAVWSTGTTTPYLWSLLTLQPDPSYVTQLPPVMKIHLVGAWILFLLVPFSRLVHIFSFPFAYVVRPPLKFVWANIRRLEIPQHLEERQRDEGRRSLVKGVLGVGGAALLLSLGVFDKVFEYFRGPQMTPSEEAEFLRKRLSRLEATTTERTLQLERMQRDRIEVARLEDLSNSEGKYFIDYQMRPALAFLDDDGLPILLSAKCTHLGCTVNSQADSQGRVLCPCHISYFDIRTGEPNQGSPAKEPLPHLGWVLLDANEEMIAEKAPDGSVQGSWNAAQLESATVYIAKKYGEHS